MQSLPTFEPLSPVAKCVLLIKVPSLLHVEYQIQRYREKRAYVAYIFRTSSLLHFFIEMVNVEFPASQHRESFEGSSAVRDIIVRETLT